MTSAAAWLFALLFVAHYAGDFSPLITRQMREAKSGSRGPGLIAAHAGVHAVLVSAAVWLVTRSLSLALLAAGIEFVTHFAFDFTKMKLGRRFEILRDPGRDPYWYLFGADQLAHALVLVAIAATVL